VIAVAVRWYLRYGLSYRDVEELLAERGIQVDHVTVYRWVQTFTGEFIDAARPSRHVTGDRWFVDESSCNELGRDVICARAGGYRHPSEHAEWRALRGCMEMHGTAYSADLNGPKSVRNVSFAGARSRTPRLRPQGTPCVSG
jgi:hypothetical protein